MSNRNEYPNIVITGVWETKNGHLNTMPLDAKAFDALSAALEHGGKILIRKRSAESIANSRDPEKAPTHYLEFVPRTAVEEYQAKNPRTAKQRRGLG